MKSLRYILPLLIFLSLCGLFYTTLDRDIQLLPSPLIGKPVPDFLLPRLLTEQTASQTVASAISAPINDQTSATIQQDSYIGKKWLLNIWASWCAACRVEHPLFNQLNEQTDWHLVGLNYKDEEDEAKQWLKAMLNPYSDIIFDKEGTLGFDLGVYGVPETFLVDEQGKVQFKHVGPICKTVIEEIVVPFFQDKPMNLQASCRQ